MRVMAIDYGDARIGLATSDLTGSICGEAWVLTEADATKAVEKILIEVKEREVSKIILGLPKNMDGTEGERAQKSHDFKALLENSGSPEVLLWDERRTTVDAHRILHDSGYKMKKHKKKVDAVAASLILEGYLNSARP